MESARVQTGVSLVQLEERIVDARARVITRESEHQLAQQEKGRAERLFRVEAVPARRLEIAESKLRIAEANLTAATDNLQALLRARTELASPQVEADVQHRRLPLHSPGWGRLVQSTAAPGAFASRDQTLFRIVDLSRVWIRGEIHQSDLNDVAGATSALVQLTDGSQIVKTPGRRSFCTLFISEDHGRTWKRDLALAPLDTKTSEPSGPYPLRQ